MYRRMICLILLTMNFRTALTQEIYHELYRPQIHFSPKANWMNDPNGMVFYKGVYHLFFQYYPDSTVWGPMHWGHATSQDLLHWKEQPVALYPDSLGYIFSGSAVVDSLNRSGFGTKAQIPLIAMFTLHDPVGEKSGTSHFQNQGIAYSLDAGMSWIKYTGNPVLKSPGLKDFRDPKMIWMPDLKKWIVVLAAGDRVMFYSSADLKHWNKESEFGQGQGAHGGVWECPDLLPFSIKGKTVWMLIVSINPGAYQGGSGTQYFMGEFDGKKFQPADTLTRWLDYGADDYAGVTFSNTGKEKIFIGWMSSWQYAMSVPTVKWRSAMTIPRILGLKKIQNSYFSTQMPVSLKGISKPASGQNHQLHLNGPYRFDFECSDLHDFELIFSNAQGRQLGVGFDQKKNAFYIDRRKAGIADFYAGFAAVQYGPRISSSKDSKFTLILDNASIELFADDGLTTMTDIFFTEQPYQEWRLESSTPIFNRIGITKLTSIWP